MKATVLLFNFSDRTRLRKLKCALLPLRLKIKEISKEDYLQPVGYLAGDKDIAPVDDTYIGDELDGEMLLMAGMGSGDIDLLLKAVRRQGLGRIDYKAVLTETNKLWNPVDLFTEIKKEHEAMSS